MAKILRGRALAESILDEVSRRAQRLHSRGVTPTAAVINIGSHPASRQYVGLKSRRAKEVGIDLLVYNLPAMTSVADIKRLLVTLSLDKSVHGIIIQLPLPPKLKIEELVPFIDPDKDIEDFGDTGQFTPPTPMAVVRLLAQYKIKLKGQHIALVGRGFLVGRPLGKILETMGARVAYFDRYTKNLPSKTKPADILISACGRPNLITGRFVRPGQAVVDVGVDLCPETGCLVGDVDRSSVKPKVAAITPRAGGVGPVTVALLLQNIVIATQKHHPETK